MLGQRGAESFFATLKNELIERRSWSSVAQVRTAVVEYIEVFYNRRRLHSSLGYLSPAEYEAQRIHHHRAAQAAQSGCPADRVTPTKRRCCGGSPTRRRPNRTPAPVTRSSAPV